MPISINGTGTITGISAGGLPDDCITTADIAGSAVTPAKLSGAQSGSAPIYGARAWVNFDGTRNEAGGSDSATTNRFIRGNGNVSSVLRNGTGDYTVTFSTAMSDANYAAMITGDSSGARVNTYGRVKNSAAVPTASALRIQFCDDQSSVIDTEYANVSIFR
jgi:hypothetical protein